MILKRMIQSISAMALAGAVVIGGGAMAMADGNKVTAQVEERELLFWSHAPQQTFEFIPEYSGEYVFESWADRPNAGRIADPWIKVTQEGDERYNLDGGDGVNFKLSIPLKAGVPCKVVVQCQGYYDKAYVPVTISRSFTEKQIADAKAYLKTCASVVYAGKDVTEKDIDEALADLSVEELISYCHELGYSI